MVVAEHEIVMAVVVQVVVVTSNHRAFEDGIDRRRERTQVRGAVDGRGRPIGVRETVD